LGMMYYLLRLREIHGDTLPHSVIEIGG